MRARTFALALLPLLLACNGAEDATTPPSTSAEDPVLELRGDGEPLRLPLSELREKLSVVEFEVRNPEVDATLRYRGFALPELLALAGIDLERQEGELIFHCADGYAPSRNYDLLASQALVLAFEEVGGWTPIGGKTDPGPFYLVSRKAEDYAAFPWPYQVVGIEAIDAETRFQRITPPSEDEEVLAGFELFRNQCMSCHSINLVGGTVGPELNVPRNITTYRSPDVLREFIRDPAAFRARSPMPPFPALTEVEIDALLAYLAAMAEHQLQ